MYNNFFELHNQINFDVSTLLLIITLILLIFINIRLVCSKSLLENIIIMSAFSMLISLCYLLMDAPDVAMTEVALGACLSTCVLLNFIRMVDSKSTVHLTRLTSSSILCILFIVALTYLGQDMVEYGFKEAPLHRQVSRYYLENTQNDMGLPSPVAAILASYRGYDTLGETSVILIAGLAVRLILSLRTSKEETAIKK